MAKNTKSNEEDAENLKQWLQAFEAMIGQPAVVSLLIKSGEIIFYSCFSEKHFNDSDAGELDDEVSEVNLNTQKEEIKALRHDFQINYIG